MGKAPKQEKTRYSDKELEEFRVLIEERIAQAQEQLEYLQNQLRERMESEESKVRSLDDAADTSEMTFLISRMRSQKKLISHLENALLRIDNKVYGICRETGKLISKERLKAVPHATLSILAKQNKKKR
ncbi:MAG TPA: TraR/DksA family transcriptional regulator [Phaeodactylibacter sp.]|nr:TraR/DksA family transcriptional regulator [Phaeodactylibacter sp.]